MNSAFELLSFVLRSENRLTALLGLSAGPTSRADLQAATDIPRATLSRILADCADRALVERSGREYALTPLGSRLVEELLEVFEAIERLQALQTLRSWLPVEELDVDLFAVEDLDVTLPSRIDPMAPIGRAAETVGEADLVRGFCYSLLHAPILAMTRDIVESGSRFEGVVSADILEFVASDPELVGPVSELIDTGQAEVLIYEGGIETQFIIADDLVSFVVTDPEGSIQGLVETANSSIRAWAEDRFEAHRATADPLDRSALAELLTA